MDNAEPLVKRSKFQFLQHIFCERTLKDLVNLIVLSVFPVKFQIICKLFGNP